MNIFRFEFNRQLKSTILWSVSILLGLLLFMMGIWPSFETGAKEMIEVLNGYPKGFMAAFGFDLKIIFSYLGFYSFTFSYLALIGAIMAAAVSISVFSREKSSKCMDYILTKPVGRVSIFLNKLLTCFTIVIISSAIYIAMVSFLFSRESELQLTSATFLLSAFAFFFNQLMFMSFGVCFGVLVKKIRSVSGAGALIGILAFALSALANILEKQVFQFLAPLKYFDPTQVIINGHYDMKLVLTGAILSVVCILAAYHKYCKTDVAAV